MKIERFEDLRAWQIGRELSRAIYASTTQAPFAKDFGLRDQIQRAAGSVMHNVAEGFDAGSNPEFIRFLQYAQRSATEVMSQLYIAVDQHYIDQDRFAQIYQLAQDARKTIGGLIKYLRANPKPQK
jgi:four helix bundle protein